MIWRGFLDNDDAERMTLGHEESLSRGIQVSCFLFYLLIIIVKKVLTQVSQEVSQEDKPNSRLSSSTSCSSYQKLPIRVTNPSWAFSRWFLLSKLFFLRCLVSGFAAPSFMSKLPVFIFCSQVKTRNSISDHGFAMMINRCKILIPVLLLRRESHVVFNSRLISTQVSSPWLL